MRKSERADACILWPGPRSGNFPIPPVLCDLAIDAARGFFACYSLRTVAQSLGNGEETRLQLRGIEYALVGLFGSSRMVVESGRA